MRPCPPGGTWVRAFGSLVSTCPFGGTQVSTCPSEGTWVRSPALHLTPLPCSADETSFEVGVKVQIHSQDEPPFIDQLGFGVAPGFQTFVSCQQQRVSGHGARGWAQTPEGLGWAPGGIGMDPQRARDGDPKGSEGTPKAEGLEMAWCCHRHPCGDIPSHGYHSHPPGDTPCPATPWVRCHGSRRCGAASCQVQAAPVQAAAPAATPGSCGTAARGVAAPGPRSQTPKFRCLGWVSPRVRRRGGSSTAAAGMWPCTHGWGLLGPYQA